MREGAIKEVIEEVINFDMPQGAVGYIHKIGRTGRAYDMGESVSLAEFLVKTQQDIGETMGQLGLAFVKLTKFETDEAQFDSQRVRSADMKNGD